MPATSPHVLIISRNTSTSAGLRAYFDGAGIQATTNDLLDVPADSAQVTVVVVFPDEFPEHGSSSGVRMLARRLPSASIVVVTRHTTRFEELSLAIEPQRLFVFPRPVWGWALLDRILQPHPLKDES